MEKMREIDHHFQEFDLPVYYSFVNESYTSHVAGKLEQFIDREGSDLAVNSASAEEARLRKVDAHSACLILEMFLEDLSLNY